MGMLSFVEYLKSATEKGWAPPLKPNFLPVRRFDAIRVIVGMLTVMTATSSIVYGQTVGVPAPARVFTLEDTINAALATSSDVSVARHNVEIDRRRADEAAAAARPNLNASASATRFDAPTTIAIAPNSPPVTIIKNHTENLSINLADRLDITGQVRAATSSANLQTQSDQFALDQARQSRILQAKRAYYTLLRAQHQVDVAQAALTSAIDQQQLSQKLYAGGIGQKIDVLSSNTRVAQAQQNLLQARSSLSIAHAAFNNLVGLDINAPSNLIDPAGGLLSVTAPAAGQSSGSSTAPPEGQSSGPLVAAPGTPAPGTSGTSGTPAPGASATGGTDQATQEMIRTWRANVDSLDLNTSIQTALSQRPVIQIADLNRRIALTGVKIAHAGLEPAFSVDLSGNYYPTTSFQAPRARTGALTATVALPLYDGGATNDRVAEARERVRTAEDLLGSRKSDVTLEVQQDYLDLINKSHQLETAQTALEQARAARELAFVRYQGQVGLYLEVSDAQAALVQSQTNFVNAIYDYLTAEAVFENAIGVVNTKE